MITSNKSAANCIRCGSLELATAYHCEPCRQKHNAQTIANWRKRRGKSQRKRLATHCSNCGRTGHNRATCQSAWVGGRS